MQTEPAAAERAFRYKMPKIIFHNPPLTPEEIEERRFQENLALPPKERIKRMFALMALSAMFKKDSLKQPRRKGIILKRKI